MNRKIVDEPPRQQTQASQRTAPIIPHALVRDPGSDATEGLTAHSGPPLCLEQLQHQHAAYCDALTALGVKLIRLAFSLNDLTIAFIQIEGVVPRDTAANGSQQPFHEPIGSYRREPPS